MSTEDNARVFYESARSELIERIGHRDNVLILYLGGVGALYGVALGTTASLRVLLAIPYLALGAATILSQHHAIIGQIGYYLATELHPFFESKSSSDCCPPQWDTSKSMDSYHHKAMDQRFLGHLLLIVVPAVSALMFTNTLTLQSWTPENVLWWTGAAFTALSAWVVVAAHYWRKSLQKKKTNAEQH